jgi:hypothetical protein
MTSAFVADQFKVSVNATFGFTVRDDDGNHHPFHDYKPEWRSPLCSLESSDFGESEPKAASPVFGFSANHQTKTQPRKR